MKSFHHAIPAVKCSPLPKGDYKSISFFGIYEDKMMIRISECPKTHTPCIE